MLRSTGGVLLCRMMLAFEGFWAQPRLAAILGPQTATSVVVMAFGWHLYPMSYSISPDKADIKS